MRKTVRLPRNEQDVWTIPAHVPSVFISCSALFIAQENYALIKHTCHIPAIVHFRRHDACVVYGDSIKRSALVTITIKNLDDDKALETVHKLRKHEAITLSSHNDKGHHYFSTSCNLTSA